MQNRSSIHLIILLLLLFKIITPISSSPGTITIYFYSQWPHANIHYNADNKGWTPVPGVAMSPSQNKTFPYPPWMQYFLKATTLQFVFNDGKGNWQHGPNGRDFEIHLSGIYAVKGEELKTIITYPNCPNNCSQHGKCTDGKCVCDSRYYMPDCSKYCPDGYNICFGTQCIKEKCALPGCEIFTDGQCKGREVEMPPEFEKRRWQTPKRNSPGWKEGYQDYSHLQGHIHVEYSKDHKSAMVQVKAITKEQTKLKYSFNGIIQDSPIREYTSDYDKSVNVVVYDSDGHTLALPPIDFIWNTHTTIKHKHQGDYRNGQKGAIVEMFGWRDVEIEKECELIGNAGYLGVKLFPHQEQVMSVQPFEEMLNPWYFMYQPVSYNLNGRMGTREDLRRLIQTCRSHGVRVYADAVVNHMAGNGNDVQFHRTTSCVYWPPKNSSYVSPYYTQGFCYEYNENTNLPPSQEFPAVPYGPLDFHCERALSSWTDPLVLNAGWLSGLTDLNTEREYVRERIADYFTDLIGIGFSGFRLDAFKHVKPDDWVAILKKFKRNLGNVFPDDLIIWGELLVGGEAKMLLCDTDSGYNFGKYFENRLKEEGFTKSEIDKIKIWASWFPKEPDADCGMIDRHRQVIQNDDHDQQKQGSTSRDMQDHGSVLVIEKNVEKHRMFEIKLFDNPRGVRDNDNEWPIRMVLSSYYFHADGISSIPDGLSDCKLCRVGCNDCKSVPYKPAHVSNAKAYDGSTGNMSGYTLVHRDQQIIEAMQRWMKIKK